MPYSYVHGYSHTESLRLQDQAETLEDLLHHDTDFPSGSHVLEAGCGTGAQTEIIARRAPDARITAVDISAASLGIAAARVKDAGLSHVEFKQADLGSLPYPDGHFDHVVVCFVLEHLAQPAAVIDELKRVLRSGGTFTAIEGDHGSFYCHPETPETRAVVDSFIQLQALSGGDACIGRRLFPLLSRAGLCDVQVQPKVVYVDESRPAWEEGFSRRTFIAMMTAAGAAATSRGLITKERWDRGIQDLNAATGPDSSFHYTFFKGKGRG